MRFFTAIGLFTLCGLAFGQRSYVFGVVKDSLSKDPLIGVHIQNIDAGSLTSTNDNGRFRIPINVGDTLVFSSVGHQTLAWVVDSSWLNDNERIFLLPVHTTYLEEVIVGEFPAYEHFKEMIMEEQPKDTSFKIFGIPEVIMDPYPQLEKREYLNPVYAFFHPVSALHHSFSKKEKEKRKIQQLLKRETITTQARLKFTRDWVAENTGLEGDKLTSFIAYCDFSDEYLAKESLFAILQQMMALLPDFLNEYERN